MVGFGLISLILDEIDWWQGQQQGAARGAKFQLKAVVYKFFLYLILSPSPPPFLWPPPWGYARRQADRQAAIQPHIISSPSPPLVGKVMGARLSYHVIIRGFLLIKHTH